MFSSPGLQAIWRMIPLILRFAMIFAAVSAGLSLLLRAITPAPDMIVLTPKLSYYQAHAADYDTVFIGTSRTLYHVVPDRLDIGMQAAGCPAIKAFNMGIHGLNGSEEDWLIEQVLAAGEGHLKRVILEDPLPEARRPGQVTNARARYFHGPSNYGPIIASIWSFPEGVPKRMFRIGILGFGITYDLSGVGRMAEAVFPGPDPSEPSTMNLTEHGFEALDEVTSDDIILRRQDFIDRANEFAGIVASYNSEASVANLEARSHYMQTRLEGLEAQGLEVALYVSPDVMELDRTPLVGMRLAEIRPDMMMLNFNQPDKFPGLFDRVLWQDYSHYSRAGAEYFSLELGREMCRQSSAEAG